MVRHARISKLLAAVALAALLAGCGSSGGGAPSGGGSSSAGSGQSSNTGGSSSSAGGSSAAAGSVVQGSSGAIVPGVAAGSVIQTHQSKITSVNQGVTQGSGGSVLTPAQQRAAERAASQGTSSSGSGASKPATSSKPAPPPPTTHTTPQSTQVVTVTTPAKTKVKTVTVVKTRTKTNTKVVVHVRTVIHTVTTTVPPKVPAAAFLPSRHPVLVQHSFLIAGGNVGCEFLGNAVRCAVQQRVWAPPVPPASCKSTWGDTIALQGGSPGGFVCGGANPIVPDAKVIPAGWDDKVGNLTCEVRNFGVDCFSLSNHGFIISRTGYTLY